MLSCLTGCRGWVAKQQHQQAQVDVEAHGEMMLRALGVMLLKFCKHTALFDIKNTWTAANEVLHKSDTRARAIRVDGVTLCICTVPSVASIHAWPARKQTQPETTRGCRSCKQRFPGYSMPACFARLIAFMPKTSTPCQKCIPQGCLFCASLST